MNLRTVVATRYVTPLREGGSLPAIVEADDDGLYVLKFRGAGQGAKALVAELVAGEIGARARPAGARDRPRRPRPGPRPHRAGSGDPGPDQGERRAQSRARLPARRGHVRSGRRAAGCRARVVDRLVRRLRDQRRPHGAQHQHADVAPPPAAHRPRRGALLPPRRRRLSRAQRRPVSDDQGPRAAAPRRRAAGGRCAARPADHAAAIERIVDLVPEAWLAADGGASGRRAAYAGYLRRRLEAPHAFLEEAIRARPV